MCPTHAHEAGEGERGGRGGRGGRGRGGENFFEGRQSTEVDTCESLHVLNEYARPHHTTPACPDVKALEEEDAAEVVRDSFVRVV